MMGNKKLSEIRASLLEACAKAGVDPAVWFDEQILKARNGKSPNTIEIETLKLVRDGLRSDVSRKQQARKRLPTR
jgi:hypothetical protein